MKMSKVAIAAILPTILVAVAGLVYAQAKDGDAKPAASAQAVKPAADEVLATVNGKKIMKSETVKQVEALVQRNLAMLGGMSGNISETAMEGMKTRMRAQVVEGMIDQMLIKDKLRDKKIVISDDQVDTQLAQIADQNKMTMDDVKKQLARMGTSLEDFREQIRLQLGVDKLFETEMSKDALEVTEAEAKEYYEANQEQFSQPEQVRASHILIDTRGLDEAAKAEAKTKVDSILEQVKAGGDFAELAKEHSSCPSSARGGDLNFFGHGQMVPEFDKAAFALKVGEVSDVVETQFGYHIIKLTDRKEAEKKEFAEVKDQIVTGLERQAKQKFWQDYRTKLREGAKITMNEEIEKYLKPQQVEIKPQSSEAKPVTPAPSK